MAPGKKLNRLFITEGFAVKKRSKRKYPLKSFYLTDIKASGNLAFRKFADQVERFEHSESCFYWDAKRIAWGCQTKKLHGNFKGEKRELINLWNDVFQKTGIKLNGIDLGNLYLKVRQ